MNTEMMALYRQKGVNPASGCVPMLLTLPILFAFYAAMLSVAIGYGAVSADGSTTWPRCRCTHPPIIMGGTML